MSRDIGWGVDADTGWGLDTGGVRRRAEPEWGTDPGWGLLDPEWD
ncbi:hypothetical protein [Streptomyces sp. NPDC094049]